MNDENRHQALVDALMAKVELLRAAEERVRQALLPITNTEDLTEAQLREFVGTVLPRLQQELGHVVALTPTECARQVAGMRRALLPFVAPRPEFDASGILSRDPAEVVHVVARVGDLLAARAALDART